MKFFNDIFLRCIALILLVAFTFVSCINPINPPPDEPSVVITPGEGNPRYVYIDSDGNITEEDQDRTALFIEGNKNAEGVLIVSDRVNSEDRVSISNQNNNSIVSMFFKTDSNFPYYMTIKQNEDIYYAYLSYYKSSSSTYDIIFQKDDEYSPLTDLVLSKNIFTLYHDDPELTSGQNLRLRNITIALGLWGSLYNGFDDPGIVQMRSVWGSLKSIVSGVKNVFKAVAVIAVVVAVVVAPIVAFFNPVAGFALALYALEIFDESNKTILGLTELEKWLDDKDSKPPEKIYVPVLNVKNWYEDKPITNGVEFHIGRGKDVLLEFSSPGMNNTDYKLENIFNEPYNRGYEPGFDSSTTKTNSGLFTLTLEKSFEGIDLPTDRFLIRIKRSLDTGYMGDGKIAFGFMFGNDENLHINGEVQPVEYKYSWEDVSKIRANIFVVWFCIDPKCSDYVDE